MGREKVNLVRVGEGRQAMNGRKERKDIISLKSKEKRTLVVGEQKNN